jgi:long-subunit fatty acid transport protein
LNKACLQLLCSLTLVLTPCAAWAQLEINSSPNVVGSGARALGMGSAFIAIADDATAASWNPGGLTQLERPELSLVYSFKSNTEDFSSSAHRGLNFEDTVNFNEINYGSFVYPIPRTIGGRNLVVSLNILKQYDFDRDLNFRYTDVGAISSGIINLAGKYDYSQRGGLSSLSPAFGFEITDKLSMGVVWNIYDQDLLPDNEWKTRKEIRQRTFFNSTALPFTVTRVEEDFKDFDGHNFTIGLLYKPSERWSIGAVYHTKWSADVDYEVSTRLAVNGFAAIRRPDELIINSVGQLLTPTTRSQRYTFPSAFGIGAAYRFPNDKLTVSFDITRREWDQFEILDPQNANPAARRKSGVTGLNKNLSDIDPTYTVRLGAEYVFVNDSKPKQDYLPSLRAGIFYDPEPSGGRPDLWYGIGPGGKGLKGDGKPVDFFGVSLGAGVLVKDRINLDLAYVYRFGDGARDDTFGLYGTDADVDQHTVYMSTVIYF